MEWEELLGKAKIEKCKQCEEEAKKYDVDGSQPDITKAIELYREAAKGHLPFAERRLGSLFASSSLPHHFEWAVAYYTMAVEDGDDYSLTMAEALTCAFEDDYYHKNKPHLAANAARAGDSFFRMILASYYWKGMPEKDVDRCLLSLFKWGAEGDNSSLFNYIDISFADDNEEYLKNPTQYERVEQPAEWKAFVKQLWPQTSIGEEVLIAHSKSQILLTFQAMILLLSRCGQEKYLSGDETIFKKLMMDCYIPNINIFNSFKRGVDKN